MCVRGSAQKNPEEICTWSYFFFSHAKSRLFDLLVKLFDTIGKGQTMDIRENSNSV